MILYFVSDIHIKSENDKNYFLFLNFLKNLPHKVTHLILLGDIFDLWVADHDFFKEKYSHLIIELQRIKKNGTEVYYFEGNHDLHLKTFWQKKLNFKVQEDICFFEFNNFIIRAEHGDLMNPDDKGYLFLRKFLRSSFMTWISYHLPGKIVNWIGTQSSGASRKYTHTQTLKYQEKVQNITRTHAQKVFLEKPFDLLICGHTHVDEDFSFEINQKKVRCINLGSWLDKPKFLKVDTLSKQIEFVNL